MFCLCLLHLFREALRGLTRRLRLVCQHFIHDQIEQFRGLHAITSAMPRNLLISSSLPHASRSRCSMNQADFWVTPISFAKLRRADAFARGHEQVHSVNPLVQRDLGPPEDLSPRGRKTYTCRTGCSGRTRSGASGARSYRTAGKPDHSARDGPQGRFAPSPHRGKARKAGKVLMVDLLMMSEKPPSGAS